MRIVVNALSARAGGGQTYLQNLLEHLPPRTPAGERIDVFLIGPESLRHLADGGRVEFLTGRWTVSSPIARIGWERFALPGILKSLGADVLFSPGGTSLARAPASCRQVTMFRNMIPFDSEQRRRYPLGYQRVRNWLLERVMLDAMIAADLVIFISNYARSVVERRAPGRIKCSVVISHGIPESFRRSAAGLPAPGWVPKDGYFLYVSTVDYYKNQLEVVRGFMQAKTAAGLKEKLLLVGPGNPRYLALVREEIAARQAENDVALVGSVPYDELPALYQNARVNIFASESENCPNILLEALAAGRPILCSNRPPMPEFAGDAVSYFDPRRPDELASGIVGLLGDPERETALAERSVARSRRYSWAEASTRTWEAIVGCRAHCEWKALQ